MLPHEEWQVCTGPSGGHSDEARQLGRRPDFGGCRRWVSVAPKTEGMTELGSSNIGSEVEGNRFIYCIILYHELESYEVGDFLQPK